MQIEFIDKTGNKVIITVNSERGGEILLKLLYTIPDSEFISRPVITARH